MFKRIQHYISVKQSEFARSLLVIVRTYLENLLIALFVAFILRSFVIGVYKIPTGSMEPNLRSGDFVLSWRFSYGVTLPWIDKKIYSIPPRRGDIAVFVCPDNLNKKCVKRVVGIAGDKVEVSNGRLRVNGVNSDYKEYLVDKKKSEWDQKTYKVFSEKLESGASYKVILEDSEVNLEVEPEHEVYIVPKGEAFVLGDYRGKSEDSRLWGSISYDSFESKLGVIWLSLDWESSRAKGSLVRWNRLFRSVR